MGKNIFSEFTSVGKNIKTARKKAGLTQEQLAKMCGLAAITIRQYESNKREPNEENLEKIAVALNMKPKDLLGVEFPITDKSTLNDTLKTISTMMVKAYPKLKKIYHLPNLSDKEILITTAYTLVKYNQEEELLKYFDELTADGRDEAIKRVKELTQLPQYKIESSIAEKEETNNK